MSSFVIKKTVVENLGADLESKQPKGDYSTKDEVANSIQENLLDYTTNRVLSIPQVVNYSTEYVEENKKRYRLKILKNTTYYVPNGFESDGTTKRFSIRKTINDNYVNDAFWSDNDLHTEMVFFYFKNDQIFLNSEARIGSNITSGDTAPTSFVEGKALWYDSKNNFVKFTNDSGANWYNASLPLLTGQPLNTNTTEHPIAGWVNGVTQVFNGIGFIGSHLFSLPGIKYSIANGRDENNKPIVTEYETKSVKLFSVSTSRYNNKVVIVDDKLDIRNDAQFDGDSNIYWNNGTKTFQQIVVLGYFDTQSTSPFNIVSLKQCMVDSFVTANASNFSNIGRSLIANMSMPSHKVINLTLGASGTIYRAPDNGYISIAKSASTDKGWIAISTTSNTCIFNNSTYAGYEIAYTMPVRKNETFLINYKNMKSETNRFRFIYSNGDTPAKEIKN